MKKILILVIVILCVGYFLREEITVFNFKDTFLYSSNGLLVVMLAIFTFTGVCSFVVSNKWLESMVNRYFNCFVYSTGIIFGLIHITNYENYQQYFYLIPLCLFLRRLLLVELFFFHFHLLHFDIFQV